MQPLSFEVFFIADIAFLLKIYSAEDIIKIVLSNSKLLLELPIKEM